MGLLPTSKGAGLPGTYRELSQDSAYHRLLPYYSTGSAGLGKGRGMPRFRPSLRQARASAQT